MVAKSSGVTNTKRERRKYGDARTNQRNTRFLLSALRLDHTGDNGSMFHLRYGYPAKQNRATKTKVRGFLTNVR